MIGAGISGAALALTASKSLKVAALLLLLKRKRPSLRFGSAASSVIRVTVAAGAGALIAALDTPAPGAPLILQISYLVIASTAGGASFVVVLPVLGSHERALLISAWRLVRRAVTDRL